MCHFFLLSKTTAAPNILLMLADDLGWHDLSWHNPRVINIIKEFGILSAN